MNYINIKRLEVFANHGVFASENELGQKFVVNASLGFNTQFAGLSDNVCDTLHYGHICDDIANVMKNQTMNLIESVAELICAMLFEKYPQIKTIKLELEKPWAPVSHHMQTVSVEANYQLQTVYIGLGSNLGDSHQYFDNGLAAIANLPLTRIVKKASRIETEPYGKKDQPRFLNSVIAIETMLSAEVLLAFLQQIETDNDRIRTEKWGARTLDLDILLFGNKIINNNQLVVPHPELHLRSFVLKSLLELNEHLCSPLDGRYYKQINEELKTDD